MGEKSLEEQIMVKAQQVRKTARYMASVEDLVEERIRKAREKGAFDNLEGFGKPLNLYENPFEPAEMRMANKILKDAGYAPYWVELGKDVDAGLAELAEFVRHFQQYVRVVAQDGMSPASRRRFEQRKARFLEDARIRLAQVNKRIDNYNYHCPLFWLGRERLNEAREYEDIVARVEATIQECFGDR